MKKNSLNSPGASSLMVIFAVLCLTVFAILSLSTVLANGRLANSSLAAVQNYYAADCKAEEILSLLRQGEIPDEVSENDGVYSYQIPVSDTQGLFIDVSLNGEKYTVSRWQLEYTAEWQADEGMEVWLGD